MYLVVTTVTLSKTVARQVGGYDTLTTQERDSVMVSR